MPTPKSLTDLEEFAKELGLPKYVLTRYIFQADSYYKQFRLRKSSGKGYRIISAPSMELKGVQRWINTFILRAVDPHDAATAFRPGCSIVNNASTHVDHDFVCNIDIKDFFLSIKVNRVAALFKRLGYAPSVASALAKLTTFQGCLPQGAPTSPDIANLVCMRLDKRVTGFCRKRRWSYSRYCDDISISGNGGISLKELNTLIEILKSEGFENNQAKMRTIRRGGRQVVTGLVVNSYPNIIRHQRKVWRAIFHKASINPERFLQRETELQGYLSFLRAVRPGDQSISKYEAVLKRFREIGVTS